MERRRARNEAVDLSWLSPRARTLLLSPKKGDDMHRAIICGVDGSPDSRLPLGVAASLACRLAARLIVVNVVAAVRDPVVPTLAYAPMARPVGSMPPMTARRTDFDVEAAEAMLERILNEERLPDAEPQTVVGDPAERLADLADDEGAELIVVGSRGRGAFKAAFLGSVSNSLVGVARCPVLVVPRGAAEHGVTG
jgi:nucleotide-binding universal stress UspA family protein